MMLTVTSVSDRGEVLSTSVPLEPGIALALCLGILNVEGNTPMVYTLDGTYVPARTLEWLVFDEPQGR